MFETQIGPTSGFKGYLRPETAQGQFVNFRHLLEFNSGRIPFGSACIGLGFRNEIAPRSGLLRVREFTMAEIEYFVDPLHKEHKKFSTIKDLKVPLWSSDRQLKLEGARTDLSIGEAVEQKIINNETLGYFLGKTYLFLIGIGIQSDGIRFDNIFQKKWHIMLVIVGMLKLKLHMVGLKLLVMLIELALIYQDILKLQELN